MSVAAYLHELGVVCALGRGVDALRAGVFADAPGGVAPNVAIWPGRTLHLGAVDAALPSVDARPLAERSRNNALLLEALAQIRPAVDAAIARFGAARVGVVLGTSTSGVGEAEQAWHAAAQADSQTTAINGSHGSHGSHGPDGADGSDGREATRGTPRLPAFFHVGQQEIGAPALMLARELGTAGPRHVISTACSSSAKALASAARLLRAGLCDAVVCGGADSLCRFTVAGFAALDSVAEARCNPMSEGREGINIGEAAALFLMTREPGPVRLAGWGETSDAHHISAPEPGGTGALAAMRAALAQAGLAPSDIDYLNLHGTATPQNDAMESRAVEALFGLDLPCSSTKPLTGHTLGAAGALEAAIAWIHLRDNPDGRLAPHWWDGRRDPALPAIRLAAPGERLGRPPRHVLSNSFAFGGSNAALILSRHDVRADESFELVAPV